jgi:hypothetical protein
LSALAAFISTSLPLSSLSSQERSSKDAGLTSLNPLLEMREVERIGATAVEQIDPSGVRWISDILSRDIYLSGFLRADGCTL